ncbi:MAG: AraC family transcriptional regulator [Proteobacteria bacterium]|nr:MAG: AraC family transcriptional regulator [Pseudomonadota bacterium]
MIDKIEEIRKIVNRARPLQNKTGIPRVFMVKGQVPAHVLSGLYDPMINLVVQGSKTMTIGDEVLKYDSNMYFVMSIDVPATGVIAQGKSGAPYLAVNLYIDSQILSEVIESSPECNTRKNGKLAFSVCKMTDDLYDSWLRMLRLIERPEEIAALAPLYEREILFRVLQGPQGAMLRQIAEKNSAISKMRKAIKWIKSNYASNFHIKDAAGHVGMSPTSLHRHFKAVTGMSPIQYQKQMRLLEARRLLILDQESITTIAFEVGYESSSQFTREYSRFFGMPPSKDLKRIKSSIMSA